MSINFSFDYANCTKSLGIQAGVIEGGCEGMNTWDCYAGCATSQFSLAGGTTIPCKSYYLWVDGCQGDVCQFSFTVAGSGSRPSLPTLQPPMTNDRVCACNEIEICIPSLGSCEPNFQWKINGVPLGDRSECIDYLIPETANEGDKITVCLTATIGNPNHPSSVCDQQTRCTDLLVEKVPQIIEACETVCFENQPLNWHNNPIFSSCIVPPCSTRITGINGCCEDVFKSITLLPPPTVGFKDTFLCGMEEILEPNGRIYRGEPCYEIIQFKKSKVSPSCPTSVQQCDTSYELVMGRFNFDHNWSHYCEPLKGSFYLSANVEYETDCPYFYGLVHISLVWYDKSSGRRIDTTSGEEQILITEPGTYCVNVHGDYQGLHCLSPRTLCYDVTPEMLNQTTDIEGENRVCFDSITEFSFQPDQTIIDYEWIIKGQGTLLDPKDTSVVLVKWDSLALDTTLICLSIHSECSKYEICKEVLICPETTSIDSYTDGRLFYSFATKQLFWKGLISDIGKNWLTIYNVQGQQVLHNSIAKQGERSIKALQDGTYIVHIYNKDNRKGITLKIIK